MTGRPTVLVRGGLLSRVLAGVLALAVLAAGGGYWVLVQSHRSDADEADTPDDTGKAAPPTAKPAEVGGRPLFVDWPKDNPDLVIVVSGQTHGYLSPCGCSRPQFGGLERRYNLIQQLKGKGWEVIGVDVGDVAAPPGKGLNEQALKKYVYAMKSMQEMGYVAVGVGKTDFQNELLELLGRFTLNNADKRPIVLGANVVGVQRDAAGKVTKTTPRAEMFPGAPKGRPMVEDVELVTDKKVTVGITAAVGPTVAAEVQSVIPSYGFEGHATEIKAALKKMAAAKAAPELKVLLFQGTRAEAAQVAKDFPAFQLIVCISESSDSLAPLLPDRVGNTQIVTVGHKGMNVGLMGVFKTADGLDLRYQLVPLGEEYLTPEKPQEVADNHAVLKLLEQYTSEVKQADFLGMATKKRGQHAAMVQNPNAELKYIGAQACAKCHAGEVKKWGETKHSHAYEALEKLAKRPGLRQFDPECVSCHTTGFEYESGFVSAEKTKHLMNNGCENCHGPGSGHAAKPNDKDLLKALTPWKLDKDDKLPDLKFLEKMAALPELDRGKVDVKARERLLVNKVAQMCTRCHDLENDPKFDIWTYLPKIYHSGLKQSDLPPIGK